MSDVVGGGAAMRASPVTVTDTVAGCGRARARRQSHRPKAAMMAAVTMETEIAGEIAASDTAVRKAREPQPSGLNMCPARAAQSAEMPTTAQANVTMIVS